jgi:histidine triad (HIT) family protein
MDMGCLFCGVVTNEVLVDKVYEDEGVLAFHDISPQAPLHIIIIPKKHIDGLSNVTDGDRDLLGAIQIAVAKIALQFPQAKNGFRLISNCGKDAGQTVGHLHYHLLAGKNLGSLVG